MQNLYGNKRDAKLVMQGWEIKLAHRFTVDQILWALDRYTDRNSDFPTPADIINLLDPEPPKVSEGEYIAARKWQERNNNFSQFTPAAITIDKYNAQNREPETYDGDIQHLTQAAMKRIEAV